MRRILAGHARIDTSSAAAIVLLRLKLKQREQAMPDTGTRTCVCAICGSDVIGLPHDHVLVRISGKGELLAFTVDARGRSLAERVRLRQRIELELNDHFAGHHFVVEPMGFEGTNTGANTVLDLFSPAFYGVFEIV
jgi:hypothetical protein